MPWEIILGAIGGTSISVILVVLGLLFAQRIIEKTVDTGARRFESGILQTEDAYRKRLALESQIDVNLREKRIGVYEKLWQATGLLPKWPRARNITYKRILEFSETLRKWYFEQGGMYLSQDSRVAYGFLQDAIWEVLRLNPKLEEVLKDEYYDAVREKCSALRTELTEDIVSRRAAPL